MAVGFDRRVGQALQSAMPICCKCGQLVPSSIHACQSCGADPIYMIRTHKERARQQESFDSLLHTIYWIGFWVCYVLVFFGCWAFCVAKYGFLLGVGLGWLPSGIVAAVAGFLWPLLVIIAAYVWKHL